MLLPAVLVFALLRTTTAATRSRAGGSLGDRNLVGARARSRVRLVAVTRTITGGDDRRRPADGVRAAHAPSGLGSMNDADAFSEFNRVSLYLGVFLLALQVAPRRTAPPSWRWSCPRHHCRRRGRAVQSRRTWFVLGSRPRGGPARNSSPPQLPNWLLERPCHSRRARRSTAAVRLRLAGTSTSPSGGCSAPAGRRGDHLPRLLTRRHGDCGDRRGGPPCAQPLPLESGGRSRCGRRRVSTRAGALGWQSGEFVNEPAKVSATTRSSDRPRAARRLRRHIRLPSCPLPRSFLGNLRRPAGSALPRLR